MFLLVPAYPGCPGQTAVKWLFYIHRVLTANIISYLYSALLQDATIHETGGTVHLLHEMWMALHMWHVGVWMAVQTTGWL